MTTARRAFAVLCLLVILLGSGCATNRGVLDVRISEPQNPMKGPSVMITRVTDKRVFEAAPRSPSVPSLRGKEIDDKAITSRAIARKRNGYGKAMGDILLPEGRTVENLVQEALTKAFRDAGYRVIKRKTKSSGKVIPIQADIEQFWSWVTPGFWAVAMEFDAKVTITGDIPPFKDGETVHGYVELHSQGAGTKAWLNTINKGIEAFIVEVGKDLEQE